MARKEYTKPSIKVVVVNLTSIIATSGSTGATGEDAPWASARRSGFGDGYFEDED